MINVGIYGVTGYAGYELLRWIGRHPAARVVFATSESQAGKALADVYPGPLDTPLLAPHDALLRAGALTDSTIIVDAKSGVSGAGRAPKQNTSFVEVSESLTPYSIGHVHRHVGEMEQEAARLSSAMAPQIIFTPYLLPINRGI